MKKVLLVIFLSVYGICSEAAPDPMEGKIEEVSIFEYGHTPASFEDNYNNLVRNWFSGMICEAERIRFTSFRFISRIEDKRQIQKLVRYYFGNDCLCLNYQTDTKYKTFNDEIMYLDIVIRYTISSIMSDYYNMAEEGKRYYLDRVREAAQKLTDQTIRAGYEIYAIYFELDGTPRETLVVYDPSANKVVFSSMFLIDLPHRQTVTGKKHRDDTHCRPYLGTR